MSREEFKRRILARLKATERFHALSDGEVWNRYLTGLRNQTPGAIRVTIVVMVDWLFESDYNL